MANDQWPPSYFKIFSNRYRVLLAVKKDPSYAIGAKAYYEDKPIEFINDWVSTYDPRNAGKDIPTTLPFILFDKQKEFVDFLLECLDQQRDGLVEKARDMGATWICCAFSVWLWLFRPGVSVGWGSRKEMLVDRLGDPDSIFEKMRMIIRGLPKFFLPEGFDIKVHSAFMKIINPENGATIKGESGDNIGRGGRSTIYFKDESAHYIRPKKIEASLLANTDCQIDISSVNGTATIFHQKRLSGIIWSKGILTDKLFLFILDWRDHPNKTQEWYNKKKKLAEVAGMLHLFAQEVDRDAAAAIQGVVIPSLWVNAAIDAHVKLGFDDTGKTISALDVADEGVDYHALAIRKGAILKFLEEWNDGDTGVAADKAVSISKIYKSTSLQYDCIGVGAGVKAETNRLQREGLLPKYLKVEKWNAAANPENENQNLIKGDPESPLIKDYYANLKAQAWWELRLRFERTYYAVTFGKKYDSSELISIPSDLPKRHELVSQLSQPTNKYDGSGRILINKKGEGTKSPDLADAVKMVFWPIITVEAAYGSVESNDNWYQAER